MFKYVKTYKVSSIFKTLLRLQSNGCLFLGNRWGDLDNDKRLKETVIVSGSHLSLFSQLPSQPSLSPLQPHFTPSFIGIIFYYLKAT